MTTTESFAAPGAQRTLGDRVRANFDIAIQSTSVHWVLICTIVSTVWQLFVQPATRAAITASYPFVVNNAAELAAAVFAVLRLWPQQIETSEEKAARQADARQRIADAAAFFKGLVAQSKLSESDKAQAVMAMKQLPPEALATMRANFGPAAPVTGGLMPAPAPTVAMPPPAPAVFMPPPPAGPLTGSMPPVS